MLKRLDQKIKNSFGSKKGMARAIWHYSSMMLGKYRPYQSVDFDSVERLVFICAGNICRSPLAEAVANSMGFPSVSYGLHCRGGDPADPRARSFAESISLDLSLHITRNFQDYTYQSGDLIVGMEPSHLAALRDREIPPTTTITLAGLWLPKAKPYIHDPHNTCDMFFDRCEREVALSAMHLSSRAS
ncbi:protein-tyrosine-phosphatase [Marinimicrobium koreense]|uniref:protein-tyrosine-phosphatase n=3 Tax=Marinimicrobium koreense TaxID=306545 RepID=A0A3N1NQA5_9GAMM|nr:protein-tyrosine-phosphatase [Marinimicrobium koreense]